MEMQDIVGSTEAGGACKGVGEKCCELPVGVEVVEDVRGNEPQEPQMIYHPQLRG